LQQFSSLSLGKVKRAGMAQLGRSGSKFCGIPKGRSAKFLYFMGLEMDSVLGEELWLGQPNQPSAQPLHQNCWKWQCLFLIGPT
jgi:hypothetical protein